MEAVKHVYEVRPRRDHRGFNLISDVLPFGRLWYAEIPHAAGYAMHYSRSHDAVIRVYDATGNLIETYEHKGDLKSREFCSHRVALPAKGIFRVLAFVG